MLPELSIAVFLATAISLVHLLGEELEEYISGYREAVVSFSSGVSISYVFVQLMPEFQRLTSDSNGLVFVFPLLGFSSIHLMEKYIEKSDVTGEAFRRDYSEIHFGFLFIYYAAIGYLFSSLTVESTVSGALFAFPIALHAAVSSFSMTEMHEKFAEKNSVKLVMSLAPLTGVAVHGMRVLPADGFSAVLGLVIGMFFYVVIRDSMPGEGRGKPLEYVTGVILYLAVIALANMFF